MSRLRFSQLRLQSEAQRSKDLDELEAFSRTPSPFAGPSPREPLDILAKRTGLISQEGGLRVEVPRIGARPGGPYMGTDILGPDVPRRHIFGQEAQAFAEEVAPREHRKYPIPESVAERFGVPGRIAREVTAVDPTTFMLAPLFGPSVFRGAAAGARQAPTAAQLAGTALTSVGADIPVAAGQIGRAGLRAVRSEIGGVAPELAARRTALFQESRALEIRAQDLTNERFGFGTSLDDAARRDPEIGGMVDRATQVRNEIAALGTEGGGRAPRKPAPEGALLTNDVPSGPAIQKRLREVEKSLAKPRPGNRKALITERAQLQAQAEIDAVTGSGRPLTDQLDEINAELAAVQNESRTRSLPFRGRRTYRGFVPSKGIEGGVRRGGTFAEPPNAYPDLTTAELVAREKVYREFSDSARLEPVEVVAREVPSEGGAVPPVGRPPSGPALPPEPPVPPREPPEGFAANIRLSKYPEEIRAALQEWVDANPEAVQAARRGVRSDAQVMEDARLLVEEQGGNFSKLQRRWKPGEAWNAEEIAAIRGTLRSKTEAVLEAANAARAVDSTENHARLILAMREQAQVQQAVHGVTAEAGRALRSFRQEAFDAIASNDTQKLQELMRRMGLDKGKLDAFADRISSLDLNNPVEVNNFLRSVDKPKFGDYVMEFWINSILSGPKTHIINSISNTLFAAMSPVERGLAAIVDVPLARLQGRAGQRFLREVPADAAGALFGIPEGVRAGLRTLRDGITPAQASKWEFRRTAFPGVAGRVIRLPGTLLEAADSFFYAINYRAALNSGIIRQARSEGLRGAKLVERIADLKMNPAADLISRAAGTAEYRLFRAEPGKIMRGFMSLRETIPGGRFVLPFLRTPGNLLAAGLERSPLGLANPSLWRNLATKSPEASDQIARLLLGSGIAAGLGTMIASGTLEITGNVPTNAAARDRFFREGKQPFAIKIGGQWIQYRRLEPFNQSLAQLAAFKDAVDAGDAKNANQIAAQLITTIGNNLVSQTYLSGLSDFLDAISDPAQAGARWGERIATGFVPASAALRTVAQVTDPTVRRPEGLLEQFQAGIPILSEEVPPRLTAFGRPATRETAPWSPITVTPEKQSFVDAELERLGVEVGFVGDSIGGYALNREEQSRYQELAGQVAELVLTDLVQSAAYQSLSDPDKETAIRRATDRSRDAVREFLIEEATQKAGVR